MRAGTPGANNVNLLVETVLLNYMALHQEQGLFGTKFPTNGLGNSQSLDRLTALGPICNGLITIPSKSSESDLLFSGVQYGRLLGHGRPGTVSFPSLCPAPSVVRVCDTARLHRAERLT